MRRALASPSSILVIEAARRWRRARDLGEPIQPALAAHFRNPAEGLLAPVIDALLQLFEAAFRRRFIAGAPADAGLTRDEERLLELLAQDPAVPPGIRPSLAGAFSAGLRSTRIMLHAVVPARSVPD